ncbi:MAG: S16 family serine protease, partial [Pseudomonadota bacterium]
VAGGYRVQEPAADLAVAAALISSLADKPVAGGAVVFGEIALSGAVRPVSRADARLKEAGKLGFDRAWAPPGRVGAGPANISEISHVTDLAALLGAETV